MCSCVYLVAAFGGIEKKKSKKKKEKEKERKHWGGFDSSRPYPQKTIEGAHNAQSYCSKRIFH